MSGMQTLPLAIAAEHPAYAGHFPGRPILPGVVLLDAMIHALADAARLDTANLQIKSAKFLSPVAPGEPVELRYATSALGSYRFEIIASGRPVANGTVAFAVPAAA